MFNSKHRARKRSKAFTPHGLRGAPSHTDTQRQPFPCRRGHTGAGTKARGSKGWGKKEVPQTWSHSVKKGNMNGPLLYFCQNRRKPWRQRVKGQQHQRIRNRHVFVSEPVIEIFRAPEGRSTDSLSRPEHKTL